MARTGDASPLDRVRTPAPLIRRRLPSARGATEQPNATGDGEAPLTGVFWMLVGLTGIAAGLLGVLMMLVLHAVQWLAFGSADGSYLAAVQHASPVRRVVVLLVAGAVTGVGWYLLRVLTPGESTHVDDEVWTGRALLSFRRSLGTSVLSEVVVGAGASLGREAAPKLLAAAAGTVLAQWRGLSLGQRRLLVACGGGAGMAAVYDVPLGGALITAELLYGSLALPAILPALACSGIATAVAWVYLPISPTYTDIPAYPVRVSHVGFAVLAGPLIGLLSAGFIRLIGWVSFRQARGRWLLVAPALAFGALGVLGMRYPQLLGNGQDLAQQAFVSAAGYPILVAAVLAVLKPVVTALCLGSGASGGLFTPTLATGALVGAVLGAGWSQLWPGAPVGSYALIGAAAMIGAAMQTPLAALALVVELTRTADTLIVPLVVATMLATAVARYLDGYSIYSSRLPAQSPLRS
ncbi:MAG TPA: chloride channel protein [Kineosporiaceae bacterium]|nr:chloride channel protein [Kineosporiaceae bacterium]